MRERTLVAQPTWLFPKDTVSGFPLHCTLRYLQKGPAPKALVTRARSERKLILIEAKNTFSEQSRRGWKVWTQENRVHMEDTVRSQPYTPSTRTKVLSWRNISWTVVSTWKSVPRGQCQAALSSWWPPGRSVRVVTARPLCPRGHCQAALTAWSVPGRSVRVVTARPLCPRGHCQAVLSSWSVPGRSVRVVSVRHHVQWFNVASRPGRHLDFHTAPELWCMSLCVCVCMCVLFDRRYW